IDLARILHRVRDRLLGDGVEHHALDLLILQRALFLQHVQYVAGDGFALAIGVGGEDQALGAFQGLGYVVEPARRLGVDLPDHPKIMFWIDRSVLGREVADMAKRGQNLIGRAQILVDRLGFRRRLHNDDIHVIPVIYGKFLGRFSGIRLWPPGPNMGSGGGPVKWRAGESWPSTPDSVSKGLQNTI